MWNSLNWMAGGFNGRTLSAVNAAAVHASLLTTSVYRHVDLHERR